jgi:hypothetical protein
MSKQKWSIQQIESNLKIIKKGYRNKKKEIYTKTNRKLTYLIV